MENPEDRIVEFEVKNITKTQKRVGKTKKSDGTVVDYFGVSLKRVEKDDLYKYNVVDATLVFKTTDKAHLEKMFGDVKIGDRVEVWIRPPTEE